MTSSEVPLLILFLLVLRHTCLIACIRPLRGVLGMSGVMVFSLVLSLWLYPYNIFDENIMENTKILYRSAFVDTPLWVLILKEVLKGLMLGLPLSLMFEVIPFTGRLIDTFRGVQFSEQIAPELGPRDSLLESYGGYFALWFFFSGEYAASWISLLSSVEEYMPVYGPDKMSHAMHLGQYRFALEGFLGDFFTVTLLVVIPLILLSLGFELVFSVLQKLTNKFNVGVELGFMRAGLGVFFLVYILYSGEQMPRLLHSLTSSGLRVLKDFVTAA